MCTQFQSKMTFCITNPISIPFFISEVLPDILVRRGSEFYLTDAILPVMSGGPTGTSETLLVSSQVRD